MRPHDEINAANVAAARAAGWPELTGSPAQIGWAETIRADKMREFEAAHTQTSAPDLALFREAMLREIDAGVWLDARAQSWQALLVRGLTYDELDALITGPRTGNPDESAA
ncbi:hypothetical protein [Nocardia cyriacigeorgica]|uniref:hypothetical protein n=1 Tax=Nocardia cyriacigeorgica TaxID=135487 RepID=UPI002455EFEF|nr:hypothetical protein [Nocardia cyriacigeorgica]